MRDLITLLRRASPTLDVRAWHNRGSASYVGASTHSTIEIAWPEDGALEYRIGSQRAQPGPGDVIIVPAGVEHTTVVTPGVRAKVLGLSTAIVEEVADAMNTRANLKASLTGARPRLLALGQIVFEEVVDKTDGQELVLDALTEALAVALVRSGPSLGREPGKQPGDLRIRRAMAFIEASFAEPLSVSTIARAAGMSRFHFSRLFEAQVGKSPYRYLVDLRLARAADLLRTGRTSVTVAALSVGYNDLGRFSRAFRSRFRVAPSEALAASRSRPGVSRLARIA